LARNLFGIKQRYYSRKPEGFYFASEPKGLFAAGVGRRDNLMAWSTYLSVGTYEHAEHTFFGDVFQLQAGHCASVASDGKIQIETYLRFCKDSETKCGLIPDLIIQVSLNQEEPFGGINTLYLSELCRLAQQKEQEYC
jgi:asparagine synthetase B (glutamine-hydrolysing)